MLELFNIETFETFLLINVEHKQIVILQYIALFNENQP